MADVRITVFAAQSIREADHLSTPTRAEIAHQGAAAARARAPVQTGQYRDGIHAEINGDQVSVVDDDPEAFYKEYGTSDTPAHAVLTDTMRQYGKYSGFQPRRRG